MCFEYCRLYQVEKIPKQHARVTVSIYVANVLLSGPGESSGGSLEVYWMHYLVTFCLSLILSQLFLFEETKDISSEKVGKI